MALGRLPDRVHGSTGSCGSFPTHGGRVSRGTYGLEFAEWNGAGRSPQKRVQETCRRVSESGSVRLSMAKCDPRE